MWDSPTWIGTAIRGKIDRDIAAENRASAEFIAEQNRASNERIATLNRLSNEQIASANRTSNELIHEYDRVSNEEINRARNEVTKYGIDTQASTAAAQRLLERNLNDLRLASNERIAFEDRMAWAEIASLDRKSRESIATERVNAEVEMDRLRRELTASEGAANRELTASEGQATRENAIEIARMNITQRVISDGVRLIPLVVNSSDFKFNGNNTVPPASGTTAKAATVEKQTAKQKADALFPELEPTFESLPTIKKSSGLAALGATLLGVTSGFLNFVPFI